MRAPALLWAIAVSLAVYWLVAFVVVSVARGARPPALTRADVAYWDRVADCETGSTWRGLGATYQGGLGFYWATWDWWARELGLQARYPDAGLAPRLVQIRVAKYGRLEHRGYWGCLERV
jgi:hypothetical protein